MFSDSELAFGVGFFLTVRSGLHIGIIDFFGKLCQKRFADTVSFILLIVFGRSKIAVIIEAEDISASIGINDAYISTQPVQRSCFMRNGQVFGKAAGILPLVWHFFRIVSIPSLVSGSTHSPR